MREQQRLIVLETHHHESEDEAEPPPKVTGESRQCLPPKDFVFGTMLMREFLHRLSSNGYANKEMGAVHSTIFARYLRQLVDCLSPSLEVDFDKFGGGCQKVWLKWPDVRRAIMDGAIPAVKITWQERILMTLEDAGSSHLGAAYAAIMFVVIMMSLVLVVVQSIEEICPASDGDEKRQCFPQVDFFCIMMFSLDYFARLACAPWSRIAIFDREWHFNQVVPDLLDNPGISMGHLMPPPERLWRFLVKPMNVIDALAIAPFWLTLLAGNLIPFPLTFLRTLRLLRFLRIMKLGKFDSTVAVLGTTLTKSVESIQVLMIYVVLMSLVAGAILNQTEQVSDEEKQQPEFATVTASSWWVFARILWMRHSSPWSKGYPITIIGSLVNIVYLVLKAIIWALPFGQIRQIFDQTWKETEELTEIRRSVELEDAAFMNTLWIESGKAAAIDIEVWDVDNADSMAGHAVVPVPILEREASTAVVTVALYGGTMNPWFGRPKLEVEVCWRPVKVQDGQSSGKLQIRPLRGLKFVSGDLTAQWRLTVKVPVHLFGSDAVQSWTSGPSTGGRSPLWDDEAEGGNFDIEWTSGAGANRAEPPKDKTSTEALLQKVLGVLDARSYKLDEIAKCTANIEQRTLSIEHALLDHS